MRKHWLLIGVAVLTAALALGAVACEDDEDDGDSDSAATEPADGETPDAAATEPAAGGDAVEVTMNEEAGSGVTGSATLTAGTAGTAVVVTIDSGLEEGSHASHIHAGTCAAQNPVPETALQNVEADASGAGTASTPEAEVVMPIATLQDGNHYIAVHALAGEVVSCGDIPTA